MNKNTNSNDEWSPEALDRDHPADVPEPESSRGRLMNSDGISPGLIKSLGKKNNYVNRVDDETKELFEPKKPRFTFDSITLNGNSKKMEEQMLKDVYVLDGVALLGQSTVIYASPNFGKTLIVLWLIIKAVENGNFEPSDLMYINADDSHKGLTLKLRLAEKYGVHMTAPGYNNFRANNLVQMLRDFVIYDEARGKIIVLDTLKKFTDLMDKKAGSEFGVIAREFTAKGGTLISLAHVNKNKDSDGKSIMAGTSDISDDADCIFIGDVISDTSEKIVELRNTKDRGEVQKKISFSYDQTEKDYFKLLGTVSKMDNDKAGLKRKADQNKQFINENIQIINYIKELIYSGVNSQKEIINLCNENHNAAKNKTHKLLNRFTGNNPDEGKLWKRVARDKNRYEYRLLLKYENS